MKRTKFIARVYNYNDICLYAQRIYQLISSEVIPTDISKQENLPYYIVPLDNFSSLRKTNDEEMEITLSNWERKIRFYSETNRITKIRDRIYLLLIKEEINDKLLEDIKQLQKI